MLGFFNKNNKPPRGWFTRPNTPQINIENQIYEQLKPLRLPLILLVITMAIGTIGYVIIDDFPLIDAIYQAGFTFTTVGFGEIGHISNAGRFFTIILIILGFAVFSFSIGILIEMINKGTLTRLIKERRMLQKIARLKNHFVICHHNNFTIELAKQFRQNHVPFVVVDNSPDIESIAKQNLYPYFVQGEPHTELSILKSSLSSAKGVITLSENIADNIAQVVTTRLYEKELELKKPFFIMSHAGNDSDALKLKKLGADSVVSPSKLVAQRLNAISLHPDMQNMLETFLSKKDTPINIEEVEIPDFSWLIFKKLKEARIRDLTNVSVVGISDVNGKFVSMPNGETLIGTSSKLLLIGSTEGIINAKRLIRKKTKPEELKYV
ncbi:MAG: NAD-binding protein [Campylobacteraceae bacterium]|jgi:voltage-gated potassium channel|nr:NAD-binding protein [Campylobacteraceae bacterium]